MADTIDELAFFAKATESLASAEADFAAGRYNSSANPCYYACFQAAVAALILAGIRPRGPRAFWGHEYVQAEFSTLIRRRKEYSPSMRRTLTDVGFIREVADYAERPVSVSNARQALRLAREFVAAIREEGRS